jgi:signal transduction histidine kinase
MLKKNVSSLHSLLDDVMDLARLQAGHEQRQVKSFDAAVVLREFCERMQPLAEERGLYLKAEGPATLLVEGDAVKTQAHHPESADQCAQIHATGRSVDGELG